VAADRIGTNWFARPIRWSAIRRGGKTSCYLGRRRLLGQWLSSKDGVCGVHLKTNPKRKIPYFFLVPNHTTNGDGENAVGYRAGKHVGHRIPGRNTPAGYYSKLSRARPRSDVVMISSLTVLRTLSCTIWGARGPSTAWIKKKTYLFDRRISIFSVENVNSYYFIRRWLAARRRATATQRRLENT